jgi:hypothetical protein
MLLGMLGLGLVWLIELPSRCSTSGGHDGTT